MLKTQNRSVAKGSKLRSKAKVAPAKKKSVKLTAEQQARLLALREMQARWQKEWDALSPEQQKEQHQGWKRAMNQMNEDRRNSGQRLLFLEPIE